MLTSLESNCFQSFCPSQADRSSVDHKKAVDELDTANSQVKACWDALMEAQRRASEAEKNFIATKLKEEVDHQLVKDVSEQVEKHQQILEESIMSSDKYCDVLKSVEKYIHGRWDPWREVVKTETKNLVTEVCEIYSISEKSLGDIIDRKMSQVSRVYLSSYLPPCVCVRARAFVSFPLPLSYLLFYCDECFRLSTRHVRRRTVSKSFTASGSNLIPWLTTKRPRRLRHRRSKSMLRPKLTGVREGNHAVKRVCMILSLILTFYLSMQVV